MTQSLANFTIDQSVEFLANRQVGLRYSCAPSLEKFAQNPLKTPTGSAGAAAGAAGAAGGAPAGGAPAPTGSTLAAMLADPSVQAALWGTAGGGIIGALAGLRRKKERRNLLRDALTGALAGGVGLGGLHLAGRTIAGGLGPKVTPETLGLPRSAAEQEAFSKAHGENWQKVFTAKMDELPADQRAAYMQSVQGPPGAWKNLLGETVRTLGHVPAAGAGYGQLAARTMGADPESTTGQVLENIGGYGGGGAAALYGGSLAANAAVKPLDYSASRLQSIHQAMGATTGKDALPTDAAKNVRGLWDRTMGGVGADHQNIIRAGMDPAADGAARQKLTQLLINPDVADVKVQKSLKNFLTEVRKAEKSFAPNPDSPNTRWGGIEVPDANLGLRAAAAQRGMGPQIAGRNKYNINRIDAPVHAPKKWTARFPKKLRGWSGILAGGTTLGVGSGLHQHFTEEDDSAKFKDLFQPYIKELESGK